MQTGQMIEIRDRDISIITREGITHVIGRPSGYGFSEQCVWVYSDAEVDGETVWGIAETHIFPLCNVERVVIHAKEKQVPF